MDNWKQSLDRYLTQEPPDDSWYWEKVADLIEAEIDPGLLPSSYNQTAVDKWIGMLFIKDYSLQEAAIIINKLLRKKMQ